MIRRSLEELTTVLLNGDEMAFHIEDAYNTLKQKRSDTIYFINEGKLYGIVSVGDIKRCQSDSKEYVKINHNFTYLTGWNEEYARKIFEEKIKINKLPVVDEDGYLLGDYSRWDDIRWYKRNRNCAIGTGFPSNIYLVKPGKEKEGLFEQAKLLFEYRGIVFSVCEEEGLCLVKKGTQLVFVDEDELRAMETIYPHIIYNYEISYCTFRSLVDNFKLMKEEKSVFCSLEKKGVACYTISRRVRITESAWEKEYYTKLKERMKNITYIDGIVPEEFAEDFFAELYTQEYHQAISDLPFDMYCEDGVNRLKDVKSPYLNVIDGKRVTVGQPLQYEGTIYFFGPCIIIGRFVEDKNTVESLLQKKLNIKGNRYRVANCGVWNEGKMDINGIMETSFKPGDIVVVFSYARHFEEIQDININEFAEKHDIPMEWTTNSLLHCNHKVMELLADDIYSMIEPALTNQNTLKTDSFKLSKRQYIKDNYIDRYFEGFDYTKYNKIGSIVMNCNPFTKGHRYIIEQAKKTVDFLIIFVVEEDRSFFNFEERFEMVQRGTEDLDCVMVVPSGNFILSQTTFPEYFLKIADEDIIKNVDYDITLFADCIASKLHITHRFVGEEPFDEVTNEYNNAMKRILPDKGIRLVEIARKKDGESFISASKVRAYLENGDKEKAFELVPETTRCVIEGYT